MRIIFMGSGSLACPALKLLLESPEVEVSAVVTQPDRPSGRAQHLKPCPVKAFLGSREITLLTPESVSAPDVVEKIASLNPDLIVVADFGQFLKSNLLNLPSKGVLNIHPSLLPKYRGAAPIRWAIANGDEETGVSIMYLNERMDAGDIILQEKFPIRDDDTSLTLEPLLAEKGADLLMQAVRLIQSGSAKRMPQNEALATLAPRLKKEDGHLDWELAANILQNRIRAFVPWPGCFCEVPEGSSHLLKIFKASVENKSGTPGQILEWGGAGPVVACGEKALRLLEVQPEGKKPMAGSAFVCGHKLKVGEYLG